jgi:3-(3-hydroxy-phenyl)propionate hydroxylase
MVGRVISPTNRRVAALRDRVIHAASVVPSLKRYILEMRFKPMPRYQQGAGFHTEPGAGQVGATSPTGTLFIQPRVDTRDAQNVMLDDVLGTGFAVLCWSNNLRSVLGDEAFTRWKALGATFVEARPMTQLHWTGHDDADVVVIGDRAGALKSWFDVYTDSVLFVRPDRCIAGACIAQRAPEVSASLFDVLCLTQGGGSSSHGDTGPVLHVAQSATEPSGTVAGSS